MTQEAQVVQPRTKVSLKVENIVASGAIAEAIDLETLAARFPDVVIKTTFPGAVVRLHNPKATCLLFRSGKVVITGTKYFDHIPRIMALVSKRLCEIQAPLILPFHYSVQNIVAGATVGASLDLDDLALALENAIYEPEVFPGLIYRVHHPISACFIVFSTGRFICTGTKGVKELTRAVQDFFRAMPESSQLV